MTRFAGRTARARRTEDFEELYRLHAPAAWRVAWVVLRNPDDAADAVAEAFSRLYAAGLPSGADTRAYLLAAVRNAAIDVLRKSCRLELTGAVEVAADVAPGEPADPAVAGENRAYLVQAFAELPERWRSALWLIDVEELSTRDAGSVLGVTANTAAQLASRARSRVRQQFLQAHVANHVRPGCRTTVVALGAHAAGTLPPVRKARVDHHLASCDDCAARQAELSDLRIALRTVPPPLPLALLDWTAPRQRGSVLAVLDQLQAAPSTMAAQVVAHASPAVSVAGERLVAAATATVLVASMSVAALRGGEPAPSADGGGRPPAVVAAASAGPALSTGTGTASGSGGGGGGGPFVPAAASGTAAGPPSVASAGGTGLPPAPGSSPVASSAAAVGRPAASTGGPPAPLTGLAPPSVPAVLGAAAPLVASLAGTVFPAASGAPGSEPPPRIGSGLPAAPLPSVGPVVGGLVPAASSPTAAITSALPTVLPTNAVTSALPIGSLAGAAGGVPLGPVLRPVASTPVPAVPAVVGPTQDVVSGATAAAAPVTAAAAPVTSAVAPVGSAVAAPVSTAAAPVTNAAAPVTNATAPVTAAAAPVTSALPATGGALAPLLGVPGGLLKN